MKQQPSQHAQQKQPADDPARAQRGGKLQGEGDSESARRYDADVKQFVESGKVEQAARQAAPKDAREQQEMQRAEEVGKAKAKR